MARNTVLSEKEKARKNREYELLKDAAISAFDALPEDQRAVISSFATRVKSLELTGGEYYPEGTFYHLMDVCKHAYYQVTRGERVEPVTEDDALLVVQPTPAGNVITEKAERKPRVAKAAKQPAEIAQSQDAVMDALSKIAASIPTPEAIAAIVDAKLEALTK